MIQRHDIPVSKPTSPEGGIRDRQQVEVGVLASPVDADQIQCPNASNSEGLHHLSVEAGIQPQGQPTRRRTRLQQLGRQLDPGLRPGRCVPLQRSEATGHHPDDLARVVAQDRLAVGVEDQRQPARGHELIADETPQVHLHVEPRTHMSPAPGRPGLDPPIGERLALGKGDRLG